MINFVFSTTSTGAIIMGFYYNVKGLVFYFILRLYVLFPVLYPLSMSITQEIPSLGSRLAFDGILCTVRFVGRVEGTAGQWLGVEWDDPTRGKHAGDHKGVNYFDCTVPLSKL